MLNLNLIKAKLYYADDLTETDFLWPIVAAICPDNYKWHSEAQEAKFLFDHVLRNLTLNQWPALNSARINEHEDGYAHLYEGALKITRWDTMRNFCCALSTLQNANNLAIQQSFDNLLYLAELAEKDAHPEAFLMLQDFLTAKGENSLANKVKLAIDICRRNQPSQLLVMPEMMIENKKLLTELQDALRAAIPAAVFTPMQDFQSVGHIGTNTKEQTEADRDPKKRKALRESI